MRTARFQTDMRWWTSFSFILFIPALWIPWVPIWDSIVSPVEFLSITLRVQRAELQPCIPVDYVRLFLLLALIVCLSAIAALAIGWVLQCAVVMVRDAVYKRRHTGL